MVGAESMRRTHPWFCKSVGKLLSYPAETSHLFAFAMSHDRHFPSSPAPFSLRCLLKDKSVSPAALHLALQLDPDLLDTVSLSECFCLRESRGVAENLVIVSRAREMTANYTCVFRIGLRELNMVRIRVFI